MPTLWIPRPVTAHVLPEHRIAFDGLENDTLIQIHLLGASLRSITVHLRRQIISCSSITLDELAPLLTKRLFQPRKMRPSPRTIRLQIDHKTAYSAARPRRRAPVIMVRVVPSDTIALSPEFLDEDVRAPALEFAGPLLDAFDDFIAWRERFF